MAQKRGGIMAAPNQCELRARIVSVKASGQFPDKQELQFLLLDAWPIEGPDFASQRVGQIGKGFTFDHSVELSEGTVVRAKAEYIGDARAGQFQLTELKPDDG
jgi:hypothetical protein